MALVHPASATDVKSDPQCPSSQGYLSATATSRGSAGADIRVPWSEVTEPGHTLQGSLWSQVVPERD